MTVDEAIARLTTRPDLDKQVLDSPFFRFWHRIDTKTCDEIAALLQQQQQQIERLKCCGNCRYCIYEPYDDDVISCDQTGAEVAMRYKCYKWEGLK